MQIWLFGSLGHHRAVLLLDTHGVSKQRLPVIKIDEPEIDHRQSAFKSLILPKESADYIGDNDTCDHCDKIRSV